jgi:hypothetical protein
VIEDDEVDGEMLETYGALLSSTSATSTFMTADVLVRQRPRMIKRPVEGMLGQ